MMKILSLALLAVAIAGGALRISCVETNGNWIYLFDSEGKKYKSLSYSSVGEVVAVAGDTFTSRKGNWVYIWDRNGKKIKSRGAK